MNDLIIIFQGSSLEDSYGITDHVQFDKIESGDVTVAEIQRVLELGIFELADDGSGNIIYKYEHLRVIIADNGTPNQRIVTVFPAS